MPREKGIGRERSWFTSSTPMIRSRRSRRGGWRGRSSRAADEGRRADLTSRTGRARHFGGGPNPFIKANRRASRTRLPRQRYDLPRFSVLSPRERHRNAIISSWETARPAQAAELVRVLPHQPHDMTTQSARVERQDVAIPNRESWGDEHATADSGTGTGTGERVHSRCFL